MDENKDKILNQDSWLPATPDSVGGFLKIDLNKVDLVTYSLNKRFRQGENGADLKMWFYDGNIPHQLDPDNASVTLYGEDSNSKFKVVSAQPDTDWQSGRVTMYLPSQCFASAGQYKRMVVEVKNSDQVIATINFNLDVLPNDFYNISIGSENFSSQLSDEIIQRLQEANDKAEKSANAADDAIKKFQSDYDALNQIGSNIKELFANNDVVSKATFNEHVTSMATKTYKASDIDWQDPFNSWHQAGGSSLILRDGVVEMSIAAFSNTSGGSTVFLLPKECRPQSEKIGVGVAMDSDGHNAEPVFLSFMPDGRVILEDTTHDTTKVVFTTAYSLALDESETNNNKPVSIIENQKDVTNTPIIGVYQPTNIYGPDGTIGRALTVGQTYSVANTGTLNGKKVLRVATNEWVYQDQVAYSYVVVSGQIKATGTAQTGYHESGEQYTMNLTEGTPFVYDRKMEIGGHIAYRVATDQYLDSRYGTV
ncbi:BppU family phage baseplate upper protein [Companilactobacillus futsaii]|uniref:DUF2479 domain-containing protein n=2 Tax=Companilactobacillus futsaii TaxID=938155 RepID=A0A5B7SXG6_9LACO|nr:BppU family phage baseplate upper protein [Companilactobacillus futsaii]KRK90530.1 hypothetical protein FC88_GL001787 [Companilactobacillus futsaii JCM 17355]QCX24596.1 DUF2479 domain-containing protein [Companilactobacillus futsaii]